MSKVLTTSMLVVFGLINSVCNVPVEGIVSGVAILDGFSSKPDIKWKLILLLHIIRGRPEVFEPHDSVEPERCVTKS
jgi:hypothetical protein